MQKEFKTVQEQIELLESRGLSIPDKELAATFLLENNYYRISGYSLTLRNNDVFFPSATFNNIIDIYTFDQELRHILMKYIEIIEVKLKSCYAHEFSRQFGPEAYLSSQFFTDPIKHSEIFAKSEKLKLQIKPHEAFLKHFIDELNAPVPLWAYVELFSIADISILYKISTPEFKPSVAKYFNLEDKPWLLENFMHSMTILRNLCAHGSRIYNRLFEQKPKLAKEEKLLLRTLGDGTMDNSHLFSFILIMRRLLSESDFSKLTAEISTLSNKISFVDLSYYGFPNNWSNLI